MVKNTITKCTTCNVSISYITHYNHWLILVVDEYIEFLNTVFNVNRLSAENIENRKAGSSVFSNH